MTDVVERIELFDRLTAIVGPAGLLHDSEAMAPYLMDWRGTFRGRARCVVKPASTGEVAAVVALCTASGVPMVPQGGVTGMCGGATPMQGGDEVVINLSRMNRVIEVDAGNNTMTVEAGCILQHVKDAAEAADRLFPLALGAQGSCEIGGNLSTNAGGVNVLRYGNARAAVLGLEVVLPGGEVLDMLKGLRKDNSGFDLKQLFIGAEGTLGIVTRAVLQLYPRIRTSATAWVAIDSPDAAVALLASLRAAVGDRISCFELISRPMLELVLAHFAEERDPMAETHPWYVLMEWSDALASLDLRSLIEDVLGTMIESGAVRDAVIAENLSQVERLWALRENVTEAQRAEGASIKHDISVPTSAIPHFLAQADRVVGDGLPRARIIAFGHVGDGNVHYNVLQEAGADGAAFKLAMRAVSARIHDIAIALGGSISAEHGLGQLKARDVFAYKSATELRVMRAIKQALDPQNLMNRGKVLPACARHPK